MLDVLGSSICSMSFHFLMYKESALATLSPLLSLSSFTCSLQLFVTVKMSHQLLLLGILQSSLFFAHVLAQKQCVAAELLAADAQKRLFSFP